MINNMGGLLFITKYCTPNFVSFATSHLRHSVFINWFVSNIQEIQRTINNGNYRERGSHIRLIEKV